MHAPAGTEVRAVRGDDMVDTGTGKARDTLSKQRRTFLVERQEGYEPNDAPFRISRDVKVQRSRRHIAVKARSPAGDRGRERTLMS
jgi:hypothetical protein